MMGHRGSIVADLKHFHPLPVGADLSEILHHAQHFFLATNFPAPRTCGFRLI